MNEVRPLVPVIYQPATFRNATPVDPQFAEIGLGFNLCDGSVVRLRMGVTDARAFVQSAWDYLLTYEARLQSAASSGIPSVDVSTPDE